MRNRTAQFMFFYGLILMACGVIGYLYHPEKAISALVSGASTGGVALLLSWLLRQKAGWAFPASLSATGVFALLFGQRAIESWEFATSPEGKTVILVLSSIMCIASAGMLAILLLSRKR